MQRKYATYLGYLAVFCVTFISTAIFLHEEGVVSTGTRQQAIIQGHLSGGAGLKTPNKEQGSGTHYPGDNKDFHPPDGGQQRKQKEEKETPPPKRPPCPANSPRHVIIVTYGRSGSSLTNDIISVHPHVFSYFEPLHDFAEPFQWQQSEYFRKHQRYLHLTDIPEYNNEAVRMLQKLLICDFHGLNKFAMQKLNANERSTRPLLDCMKLAQTLKQQEKCLMEVQERCEKIPMKSMKVIRLSVKSAGEMMKEDPCLKLVYLVRDPRGSYFSKSKLFESHGDNVIYDAERFCSRLDKDVDDITQLKKDFPDRVLPLRFESIAVHPIATAKHLCDFVDLDFNRQIKEFVYSKTHSKSGGHAFETSRANSTDACYKWRDDIPYDYVQKFDYFCRDPFFKLGYLPANTEHDIRNRNIPLLFHKDLFS